MKHLERTSVPRTGEASSSFGTGGVQWAGSEVGDTENGALKSGAHAGSGHVHAGMSEIPFRWEGLRLRRGGRAVQRYIKQCLAVSERGCVKEDSKLSSSVGQGRAWI